MKRRSFIKNTLLGSLALSGATGFYSFFIEPFRVEFTRHKMSVNNLPSIFHGKTMVQLSDLHIGERFDYTYIKKTFREVSALNPDIVVYTGDFVSYENQKQFIQLKEVMQLAPTGTIATAAVLGNHDYGANWAEAEVADRISEILSGSGIQVLRNELLEINGFNIVGLDDYWGLNFNPAHVLTPERSENTHLILCHNPDVCDLDVWHNYTGWILSGHTHGGQVKPPFLPPPVLPVKNEQYSSGYIPLKDGRSLYINRALGHLHQVRFNVRPEVTIFELQHQKT